jgi:general stress protein 26
MTNNDDLDTIRTILSAGRIASVTTQTSDGSLVSRPLALQDREFDGHLYFFTQHPSPKTDDIAVHPNVNVAVDDGKGNLSLSGTATVTRDSALIDELWNPFAEAWFEKGREDPSVALLDVAVTTAEYWSSDKPAVARAFEIVKGLVTKSAPDVGENKTVSL